MLLREHLKRNLWDKQVRPQRACIPDCSLDVVICQCIEWVDVADCDCVVFVKDVVKTTPALELDGGVFYKAALKELCVAGSILRDDVEDQLMLCKLRSLATRLQTSQLLLLLVQHRRDLGTNDWQTLLDVVDDNQIKRPAQI